MKKCSGEGQGSCKRCEDMGKWNSTWMCFLFEVEGYEGVYCYDCAKYLEGQKIKEVKDNE